MPQASAHGSYIHGGLPPLEEGVCYLIAGKAVDTSFRLLRHLVNQGIPGMCITRLYPARVQSRFGLEGVRVHWLSQSPGDENLHPSAIATLAQVVEDFLAAHPNGATVLLDGVEFLMSYVGFPKTLLLIEHLNETIMPSRATLLIPVDPRCFDVAQFALLERFMEVLDEDEVRSTLEAYEMSRGALEG